MSRKSLILLIVLLLIGGGGVAFYFHLRAQAPPEFSKVDQFLHQFPESSNWILAKTEEGVFTVSNAAPWLQRLGVHRITKLPRHHYVFTDPHAGAFVVVIVTHDSQRITDLMVLAQPADVEGFNRHLLGKFPQLERVLRVNP